MEKNESDKAKADLSAYRLERLKVGGNVLTVLITVGFGTLGLGWLNASYQDRQKAADREIEQARVRIEEIKLETERVRAESQQRLEEMKNLGSFIEIALDQRLERRLRFAEYFSFMTLSDDFRSRWSEYHSSLSSDLNALIDAETELARAQQQGDAGAMAVASQRFARLQNYSARIAMNTRRPDSSSLIAAHIETTPPRDPGALVRPAGLPTVPTSPTGPRPPAASDNTRCIPDRLRSALPALTVPHRRFEGSIFWSLTPGGIALHDGPDDASPEQVGFTPAESALVAAVLRDHGSAIATAAREFGVPAELLITSIIVNSANRPSAVRTEPGFASDERSPSRVSVGLTQILLSTARAVLRDPSLTREQLFDPALNVRAGASFLASHFERTSFDPPLVAAAENAGGVFFNDAPANRWKLRSFPVGTSVLIDRSVRAFNASLAHLAVPENRLRQEVPTFEACLRRD